MVTKFDDLFFLLNISFLTRMPQNQTKQITTKMKMTKKFKNIYKILSMVMYM